jgi:hypothetical protein
MLYTELSIGGVDYKLRLDAKACVSLERKLGKSALDVLTATQKGSLPKVEEIILIIHASLQKYHSGTTEAATYDLYDKYIADGSSFMDLIPVVLDIFKVSGFFKDEVADNSKN